MQPHPSHQRPWTALRAARRLHLLGLVTAPLLLAGTAVWWLHTPELAWWARAEQLGWAAIFAAPLWFIGQAARASQGGDLFRLAFYLRRAGWFQVVGCAMTLLPTVLGLGGDPLWGLALLTLSASQAFLATLPGLGLLALSAVMAHVAALRQEEDLTI